MTTIEQTAVERLCELLNEEIIRSGQIQRSNKTIWSVLHNADNRIWTSLLKGAVELTPTTHRNHKRILERAEELATAIDKLGKIYPNVITPYPKEYKREGRPDNHLFQNAAWHLLMMLREVYCDTNSINLPNADSSKGKLI